jgi:hypothetical protein
MHSAQTKTSHRWPAILCAVAVGLCILAAWPFAETGITDDFSYIYTAGVLARTGHLVFNGWGEPMLGWQLLPAALLIKLFGFSFTIVRVSTLAVAMLTAFLFQRSLVRAGIREWNATIGALTLALSPMYLVLSFGFLTDMWCVFALVFCFYACLRALDAVEPRSAIAWIWAAAIGNAFFGTVRQVAFLGALVMVPSAVWLLRRRRDVFRWGVVACATGYALVLYALHWFSDEFFTMHASLRPHMRPILAQAPHVFLRPLLEMPMLLLPVLLMFLPAVQRSSARVKAWLAAASLALVCAAAYMHHRGTLTDWLAPFIVRYGSVMGQHGFLTTWPTSRLVNPAWPAIGLPESLRLVLTLATLAAALALLVSCTLPRRSGQPPDTPGTIAIHDLKVLVLPFLLASTLVLAPTGLSNKLFDRYLLPLVPFVLVLLLRHYQYTVHKRLPRAALCLALLSGAISIPALHDLFSLYRATLQAADEMRSAGVPRSHIDAGFEYNGWTQISEGGFINANGIRLPPGLHIDNTIQDNICPIEDPNWLPKVLPDYSLSFDPHACGGPSTFAPVVWHRWLAPRQMPIYIVHNPKVPGYQLCWTEHAHQDFATKEIIVAGCDPKPGPTH